ncbi:MAG: DUF2007 domain-containing protein [Pseudomonadota bacterium]|nr:DUF2007 domain-containing protein [Pseudomonadota bacterium]
MKELLRTTDLVRLSWLTALLSDQQIEAFVLDAHTSVLEGSASAMPRRLLVSLRLRRGNAPICRGGCSGET